MLTELGFLTVLITYLVSASIVLIRVKREAFVGENFDSVTIGTVPMIMILSALLFAVSSIVLIEMIVREVIRFLDKYIFCFVFLRNETPGKFKTDKNLDRCKQDGTGKAST